MAHELYPRHDDPTTQAAFAELFEERFKGERHALWGEQLSQAMLNYALHATTMNRDADPATDENSVSFEEFEGGSQFTQSMTDGGDATRGN